MTFYLELIGAFYLGMAVGIGGCFYAQLPNLDDHTQQLNKQ